MDGWFAKFWPEASLFSFSIARTHRWKPVRPRFQTRIAVPKGRVRVNRILLADSQPSAGEKASAAELMQ